MRRGEWDGVDALGPARGASWRARCWASSVMGRIGQAVAHRARAFGLEDRLLQPQAVARIGREGCWACATSADVDAVMGGSRYPHPALPPERGNARAGRCAADCIDDTGQQHHQHRTRRADRSGGADRGFGIGPLGGRLASTCIRTKPHVDPRLIAHPNVMTSPPHRQRHRRGA